MDPLHLLRYCIRPVLEYLELDSPAARALVLGTGIKESELRYLHQIEGPALGIFQMEERTYNDIWDNFLRYQPKMRDRVSALMSSWPNDKGCDQIIGNLPLATAMCRIAYYRARPPLPDLLDINGLAQYWKDHYNTYLGKGVPDTISFSQAVASVMADMRSSPNA